MFKTLCAWEKSAILIMERILKKGNYLSDLQQHIQSVVPVLSVRSLISFQTTLQAERLTCKSTQAADELKHRHSC